MEQDSRTRIWAFVYPPAMQEVLAALTHRTRFGMCDWVLVPLRSPNQPPFEIPMVDASVE